MGRAHRSRPNGLGKKLQSIRIRLGLTQSELIKKLAVDEVLYPSSISLFESGGREPSLLVLLAYSNLSGWTINELVDDKVKLSDTKLLKSKS
ncbi:MAG TPA: helix-turn-helix transcriptional regulator [Pyrinomonadaceae bacterium]|nr:helix-turn-helix transcriptional regulator [Pyrinomonadaceae bacterium]